MNQNKMLVISLSVVFIVIVGGIIAIYKFREKKIEEVVFNYNGFQFRKVPTGYRVQIFVNKNENPSFFTVRSDPREAEQVPLNIDVGEIKKKEQVYVVIDPYENLTGLATMATLELENVIENQFLYNIPLNSAFTREFPRKNIGVKTCDDANETVAIIWLRRGEETNIFKEKECIIIEAQQERDLIKAADRITLTMLGILK